jgi:hypothetical protein
MPLKGRYPYQEQEKFYLDCTLQIKELASFRATIDNFTGGDRVVYMQAYCTEKNVMYQLNPGVFRC